MIYCGLFLLGTAAVLGLTYVLVQRSLDSRAAGGQMQVTQGPDSPSGRPGDIQGTVLVNGKPVTTNQLSGVIDAQNHQFRDDTLNSLLTQGGIALGGVGVAAVGFGWLMTDRVLRPLHKITDTARRVAGGNLRERIALAGPRDEIKELADTFDSMLERLDRSFDSQRRFVSNASHELRTPLAINHTLLEVAMGRPDAPPQLIQLGETLLAVNTRHERLIDGLLTLARSEQGVTERDPVDLAEITRFVLDQSDAGAVRLVSELDPAPTAGEPILLERIVQNLVQNGITYNVEDGWVSVTTATRGDTVELTVTNTGPVVPGYEIPGLFEPFRRLQDRVVSGRGTGLGLSIVRSVARAHGGDVAAWPRDGGGLVVRVTLTRHDQPSEVVAPVAGP
ncbi:MAG: sensor histidine kinase [Mycobacteriales bacterium]